MHRVFTGNSLYYEVRFGNDKGSRLTPHLFRDKTFRASRGKFGPHAVVYSEGELIPYLRQGWSVRMSMSNTKEGHRPSLITPDSIQGWK
ncbi:MAG: hypothetical protein DMG32_03760 [Acidobacteria bacterium]|nr:MAG: hypothetical protein DMG32_03760 [Acidobacteriota bacterium]